MMPRHSDFSLFLWRCAENRVSLHNWKQKPIFIYLIVNIKK